MKRTKRITIIDPLARNRQSMAKATIRLEHIGLTRPTKHDAMIKILGLGSLLGIPDVRKPYIAKLMRLCPKYGFERDFLPFKTQYKNANSACSRGVEKWFILDEDHYYEMKHAVSWKKIIKEYVYVTHEGEIIHKTKEEVIECLRRIT